MMFPHSKRDEISVQAKGTITGVEAHKVQEEMADWGAWSASTDDYDANKNRKRKRDDDQVSMKSCASGGGGVTDEVLQYLQTAYDKCMDNLRRGKRVGRTLREVKHVELINRVSRTS